LSRSEPDFIDSVEKAFRLLMAFSADQPTLRVSRAAEMTGLSRATVRRLMLTFESLGLVDGDDGDYRLTPRVLRIGYSYLSALPIWEHVQVRLAALAEEVNESCSAAALDGDEIVYVARVAAKRSMSLTLSIGSRLPAYPTSMGRVLLAGLTDEQLERYLAEAHFEQLTPTTITDPALLRKVIEETRRAGYALVDEEREVGIRSAAAPVRDRGGNVIAAVNISVNAARVPREVLETTLVPRLRTVADDLSATVGLLPS
jgi:IclR family pca regulon transcriptional regulator